MTEIGTLTGRDAESRGRSLAILALTCAALFWAGNFIAGRALRDDIDPVALNTLRWAACLALFLPIVGRRAFEARRVVLREWRLLLGLGATGIASFHTVVYFALTETTAINALLILALAPAAILCGAAVIEGKRPAPAQWLGSAVSLAGVGVLITRADPEILLGLAFNRGDFWMLGAVLIWAAYSLLLRRRPSDLPQDVALAASVTIALVLLLPVFLLTSPVSEISLTPPVLGALAYIAVFASLIAFLCWSYGVGELGPERSGQFVNLIPVFGAVLAVALLGEEVVLPQALGAALVLLGLVLVNRPPRKA
jgi:drug/metabolite transporter (DMT)-like permease